MMTRKTWIAILLVSTLILALAGCGVPEEQHKALQDQLASVQKDLAAVQKDYDATKSQAKSQLAQIESEVKKLQGELATQTNATAQARSTSEALQKRLSEVEGKLNGILDTKVIEYYKFDYQFVFYNWALPVPLKTYFFYKEQPRPAEFSKYGPMVVDPNADSVLGILVRNVQDAALTNDLRKSDIVNLAASLTQMLPHTDSDVRTPYDTYPRYPVETLFEQGGDSEDTSILVASLLVRLDYDVVLFRFPQQKHVAVGVNIPGAGGTGWEFQGSRYTFMETMGMGRTGTKWRLGEAAPEFRDVRPEILRVTR